MTISTISSDAAATLVDGWFDAWNRHDVDAVVAHYAPDVEYHSPFVAALADPSGRLVGIDAVAAYFRTALERYPDLHFDRPLHVAAGAGSVALVYCSVNGLLAVETLVLDEDGLVGCAYCHYAPA